MPENNLWKPCCASINALESHAKKLERAKYAKHRNKTFVSSRNESQSPSTNMANNVNNDVNRINNLLRKATFRCKRDSMYTLAKQQQNC